jgi:hypothetical protein
VKISKHKIILKDLNLVERGVSSMKSKVIKKKTVKVKSSIANNVRCNKIFVYRMINYGSHFSHLLVDKERKKYNKSRKPKIVRTYFCYEDL